MMPNFSPQVSIFGEDLGEWHTAKKHFVSVLLGRNYQKWVKIQQIPYSSLSREPGTLQIALASSSSDFDYSNEDLIKQQKSAFFIIFFFYIKTRTKINCNLISLWQTELRTWKSQYYFILKVEELQEKNGGLLCSKYKVNRFFCWSNRTRKCLIVAIFPDTYYLYISGQCIKIILTLFKAPFLTHAI